MRFLMPAVNMQSGSPNPDPAAAQYAGATGREYHQGKRGLNPVALPWVMELRAARFQPYVKANDKVFELGVGSGWNLAQLRCARRIGADAAGFLATEIEALGIEFVSQSTQLPDSSVNVTICHHTLEHLLEPVVALRELQRVLKPGGILILHVPWERERRYRHYSASEPNHHLYTWNPQTLGNLVAIAGFQIESVRVRRYGYDRFAANTAARMKLGRAAFRLLRTLLVAIRPLWEVELMARKP